MKSLLDAPVTVPDEEAEKQMRINAPDHKVDKALVPQLTVTLRQCATGDKATEHVDRHQFARALLKQEILPNETEAEIQLRILHSMFEVVPDLTTDMDKLERRVRLYGLGIGMNQYMMDRLLESKETTPRQIASADAEKEEDATYARMLETRDTSMTSGLLAREIKEESRVGEYTTTLWEAIRKNAFDFDIARKLAAELVSTKEYEDYGAAIAAILTEVATKIGKAEAMRLAKSLVDLDYFDEALAELEMTGSSSKLESLGVKVIGSPDKVIDTNAELVGETKNLAA